MLTTERHQLILEEINLRETVSLQELINLTNSSTSTIRRDLSQLEEKGMLKRVHGGATQITKRHEERNMTDKESRHQDEKREIARLAVSRISDGDTIYLDLWDNYFRNDSVHYTTRYYRCDKWFNTCKTVIRKRYFGLYDRWRSKGNNICEYRRKCS